jgi:hypothetical protein
MIPRARTNIFHIIKEIILGWGTAWHGKGQRYGTCLLCLTKIFVYNNSGSPLARPTAVKNLISNALYTTSFTVAERGRCLTLQHGLEGKTLTIEHSR